MGIPPSPPSPDLPVRLPTTSMTVDTRMSGARLGATPDVRSTTDPGKPGRRGDSTTWGRSCVVPPRHPCSGAQQHPRKRSTVTREPPPPTSGTGWTGPWAPKGPEQGGLGCPEPGSAARPAVRCPRPGEPRPAGRLAPAHSPSALESLWCTEPLGTVPPGRDAERRAAREAGPRPSPCSVGVLPH